MSNYATLDDIRKQIRETELIGLTDENDLGSVDTTKVDNALEASTAEIDGYLGGRHDLPLATVPPILKKLCADIAIFNLYSLGHGPPESRQLLYDNAIAFLTKVSEGKISLGAEDPEGTGSVDTPAVSSGDLIFTTDTLKGF